MTLQDACKLFLSHCRSAVSLSEHTLRAYTFDLEDFQNHAKRETYLSSLDKDNLRQFSSTPARRTQTQGNHDQASHSSLRQPIQPRSLHPQRLEHCIHWI